MRKQDCTCVTAIVTARVRGPEEYGPPKPSSSYFVVSCIISLRYSCVDPRVFRTHSLCSASQAIFAVAAVAICETICSDMLNEMHVAASMSNCSRSSTESHVIYTSWHLSFGVWTGACSGGHGV